MTANPLHRVTAKHGLPPLRHHGVEGLVVLAVIVASTVAGSVVHAMDFPLTSSSTPGGEVRLPTPRPLPPVHMPLDDAPSR